jgi:OmcA/MtrC family decaheme c-type cytochrome
VRKYLRLLAVLSIVLPVLLTGCEGDDGAPGAQGPPGVPGDPGAPGAPGAGVQANETCVICHGAGRIADVAAVHAPPSGTVTATITGAEFPVGGNASVTFTFAATDTSGNPVNVDLAAGVTNLTYLRLTLARLVPGTAYPAAGTKEPDAWFFYGARSHRYASGMENLGGGAYRFTFDNTAVLDPEWADYSHRVGIEFNMREPELAGLPVKNPTLEFVPDGSPITVTRDIVATAACNQCHNPLVFHSGRRAETEMCVMCHNINNDLIDGAVNFGPIPFDRLVHGIHTSQTLIGNGETIGDFTEVMYPQNIRNCRKCHTGADGDNWKNVPSAVACGSCHTDVNFATGAGHVGGPQANNSLCAVCHPPAFIEGYHLTTVATPNNPDVPEGLSNFEYVIDEVTVNGSNAPVVTFHINRDGTPIDLTVQPPGTTSGPSFLVAYALPQDGVDTPADYNNLGRSAGQPASVSLASVRSALSGSAASYTVTLSSAPFPAGATLRAVALQGSFSESGVGRPTPSVVQAVAGEERRTIVKSGYVDDTGQPVTDPANFSTSDPIGCLECHETLALHGGSRVNNVQVCVICHNPNLSSSGRTIDPATQTISPAVVAAVGSDPLVYPEASQHFKNLIHGIHRASDRPYEFVRNRTSGGLTGFYYNWSEVTFPGNLMDCTKCHIGNSYLPDALPAGVLFSTERTTTGDSAETLTDITGARNSVPNDTDWVNSPIASTCYYCHDRGIVVDHFRTTGGVIRAERGDAVGSTAP